MFVFVCIPYTYCGQSYQALETYLDLHNKQGCNYIYNAGNLVVPYLLSSNEKVIRTLCKSMKSNENVKGT